MRHTRRWKSVRNAADLRAAFGNSDVDLVLDGAVVAWFRPKAAEH